MSLFPIVDDPIEIDKKLQTDTILSGVLNENLSNARVHALCADFYIVDIVFRGLPRVAQLLGFYRNKLPIDPALENTSIGDALLQEPFPCIVLNEKMDNEMLWGMGDLYQLETVNYKGHDRVAMVCHYYKEEPRGWITPGIKTQEWGIHHA